MQFSKKMYDLVNTAWQEVKPYALMIDGEEQFDDKTMQQMVRQAVDFKYNHKMFAASSINPQPSEDDIKAIDEAVFAIVFNLICLVGKFAEMSDLTEKEDPEEEMMKNQIGMFEG